MIFTNDKCIDCDGPVVLNPRTHLREPQVLCGNRDCAWFDEYAELVLLMRDVCAKAHEWQHIADDTTRGEDETALGHAEEELSAAVDELRKRCPKLDI